MSLTFDIDPYPGNPKILFIGLGSSSHTHAWIDLLAEAKMNIRLFSVPESDIPPKGWNIRSYICAPSSRLTEGLDPNICQCLYPLPEEIKWRESKLKKRTSFRVFVNIIKVLNFISKRLGLPGFDFDYTAYFQPPQIISPEEWLAEIVNDWKPDVIHTLGLFDAQGGLFYYKARKRLGLEKIGKWVLQLRGGSDIALRRYNPETAKQILEILSECDQVITDNYVNIKYIKELGLGEKIASIAPIPGTGGLDTDVEIEDIVLPSKKERLLLWPKAYECPWSKALPVMEALILAWNDIKPCRIYMTAVIPETEMWFLTLPQEIRENCTLLGRIPRNELMELMKNARVLLAPSLVDGVPNSLYEAMFNAAFPIVSPLDTIKTVVKNETNVLFARNLYPEEISQALIRAMSDDALVDNAARNNLQLVNVIASRKAISSQVTEYYEHTTNHYRNEKVVSVNPLLRS